MSETLLNINQNQLSNADGSFIEIIQNVEKGKAKLVNALLDKGVDVSSASTLDDMASAVNGLTLSTGKKDYLIQKWWRGTAPTAFPSNTPCGKILIHHNAFVSINTTGRISIWQINDEHQFVERAGVDTNYSPSTNQTSICFGFTKDETGIVFYDCASTKKKVIVCEMDWDTDTLTKTFEYVIQSTVNIGQSGKSSGGTSESGNYLNSLIISEDKLKIGFFNKNYPRIYINCIEVDYENQTATEYITNNSSYGADSVPSNFPIAYWYTETIGGVEKDVIECLDYNNNIFYIYPEFVDVDSCYRIDNRIIFSKPSLTGYSGHSYPLVFKHNPTLSTKDFYVTWYYTNDYTGTIVLQKFSDNTIIDKIDIKQLTPPFDGGGNTSHNSGYISFNPSFSILNYYIENNEIYVIVGPHFIVKIDETGTTPKLVLQNRVDCEVNEYQYIRNDHRIINENNTNNRPFTFLLYSSNKNLGFFFNNNSLGYLLTTQTNLTYQDACVLGMKFVDDKGNEQVIPTEFNYTIYQNGGYRLNNIQSLSED